MPSFLTYYVAENYDNRNFTFWIIESDKMLNFQKEEIVPKPTITGPHISIGGVINHIFLQVQKSKFKNINIKVYPWD